MLDIPEANMRRTVDVSVVPMINIVFLLLLYFLVAGRLAADGPPIELPTGGSDKNTAPPTLVIHILGDNTVLLDGTAHNKQTLTQQMQSAAATSYSHVVVRADRGASAQALHQILDAARDAGLSSIQVATIGPG